MYRNILFTVLISFIFVACSNNKEVQLPNSCYEKPSTGMCRAMFYKYYYDKNDGKCKKFVWGGCGGNIPFHTLKECKKTCEN